MFSFKNVMMSLAMACALVSANVAVADTISIATATEYEILPSSDVLILGASNFSTTIGATPSLIDLQEGNFFIQASSIPDQSISYVINQDITINGITKSVAFNFTTDISAAADTLTLSTGAVTYFGNVSFQTVGFSGSAGDLGNHFFTVQAQVSAVPEPETYAMLFAGLGLLALVVKRRKA
ncbi:MAG: hypothetical protein RL748_1583 [Pseudomonadota bacterium]|jgi:hypothetical protein